MKSLEILIFLAVEHEKNSNKNILKYKQKPAILSIWANYEEKNGKLKYYNMSFIVDLKILGNT